jgi:hypothetical protein
MNHLFKFPILFCLMALSLQAMAQTTLGVQQITGNFFNNGTPVIVYLSAPDVNASTISVFDPVKKTTLQLGIIQYWSKNNEFAVGSVRKDLPPVFGYVYDGACSADFWAYKFFMWDGTAFKLILDASSGVAGAPPDFEDLDHDGTNELVFENANSKYSRPSDIFKWNDTKKVFEEASNQFPGFWEPLIQKEMAQLKSWRYSPNSRGPLAYCPIIANYLSKRGGKADVVEFLALSDQQLQFLLEDKKNNYLQQRAVEMKKMPHRMFKSG